VCISPDGLLHHHDNCCTLLEKAGIHFKSPQQTCAKKDFLVNHLVDESEVSQLENDIGGWPAHPAVSATVTEESSEPAPAAAPFDEPDETEKM
jgi:hypothetical protein